jgi:hypothetical protein
MTNILYNVNNNKVSQPGLSLVDRGANVGVLGSDVLIFETTSHSVNIVGIDNHEITNITICTGAGYTRSQHGPIIVIMHQYDYLGNGKTIHSSIQMEHYKLQVNDRASLVSGSRQSITTPDGYILPLDIRDGLPYLKIRVPTPTELDSLPHAVLTSDCAWDPTVFDCTIADDRSFYTEADLFVDYTPHAFDDFG